MTQSAHGWRSHYALLMLLFVYTMSFIDRQIMGILVQPIKQEFGVSDTAMGYSPGWRLRCSTAYWPFPLAATPTAPTGATLSPTAAPPGA